MLLLFHFRFFSLSNFFSFFAECDADPNILVANVDAIRYIDTADFSDKGVVLSNLNGAWSLAIYHRGGLLFWSEHTISQGTISRWRFKDDPSTRDVILRGLGEVHDMAVDWETELLYWTDYMHETVEVAKLDGSSRKTLIYNNIANPSAIVLDPRHG